MAVAPGSSESNFGESILVPVIFSASLSLRLVIAEVPLIFDFEETNPPSCHSTVTAILLNRESKTSPHRAFLAHYYATAIVAPPPSRQNIPSRPQVAWWHAAGRECNAFGYGKCLCHDTHYSVMSRYSPIHAFPPFALLLRCRNSANRCNKTQQTAKDNIVLFCFARLGEISEQIRYNLFMKT